MFLLDINFLLDTITGRSANSDRYNKLLMELIESDKHVYPSVQYQLLNILQKKIIKLLSKNYPVYYPFCES
jgi:predicted nucleic acid-binding protein